MRDFYPEQMRIRNTVFEAWKRSALQFGFSQYDACAVETLELLKHKSGREIVDQIYAFKDKSGRGLALRPEMTPTLARMIAARRGSLGFPLKWFAVGQCFRYERTGRGRKREHYQWNLDIVGEAALSAEAEVIACALHSLSLLGLDDAGVRVHLSSRTLLSDVLRKAGLPDARHQAAFLALDKRGKLDDDAIARLLKDSGFDGKEVSSVFRAAAVKSVEEAADMLGGSARSILEIHSLMELLASYGVRDRVKFDITIVRGLDYYTGIVFEAFDRERKFRAVFGGGRYDRLMEDMGGGPLTAVGLGFGDVVVTELMAETEAASRPNGEIDFAVGYMTGEQRQTACRMATRLRAGGKRVDLSLRPEKARDFFARAGGGAAARAVFLGPDDVARGTVRVKNLADRTEIEDSLAKYL